MKSLYIINQPTKLNQALSYMAEQDAVLLIEDAVILTTSEQAELPDLKLYVLEEDLIARGLQEQIVDGWQLVDYPQFVELTLSFDKSVSWL